MSPTASLTSSNTITVSWTAPTVSCSSIDDYIVVYNDGSGNTSFTSTGLTASLRNLQSGTTYSLYVAARSNGVAGMSVPTSPAMITTLLASTYVCANRVLLGWVYYSHDDVLPDVRSVGIYLAHVWPNVYVCMFVCFCVLCT